MANDHIERLRMQDKGFFQILAPLFFICVSFYALPWYVTLLFSVGMLLAADEAYLLAVFAGLAFFNIMNVEGVPFWASLITSYVALGIVIGRIGVMKKKVPAILFITAFLLLFIVLSFTFKTVGEYYLMTGVKSSLQLIFLLLSIQVVAVVPGRFVAASKQVFDKYFLPFIVFYLLCGAVFFDYNDRYGAAVGPQCLALELTLALCYFNTSERPARGIQFFLLLPIFITGSRTYFILACLVLAYDYFRTAPRRIKFIILTNVVVVAGLVLLILPYTDSRLNYTSDSFAGSFWGRFRNYEKSVLLIKEHPLTGNGMGSILRVLEGWQYREGFEHYRQKGDTTIIHNEYLRVLVELGILGLTAILYGVIKVWRRLESRGGRYMLFIFLMASLVENTLTLYTTGTLLFILLIAFSNTAPKEQSNTMSVLTN